MDPIGFGLENYNNIGAYRTLDGTLPVDSSGTLPSGQKFQGEQDLARIIGSDPKFGNCLASKLYTYALGRTPDPANPLEGVVMSSLTDAFTKSGLQFGQLVANIVASPTFLTRRGDAGGMP
jgi:hypothetical protein